MWLFHNRSTVRGWWAFGGGPPKVCGWPVAVSIQSALTLEHITVTVRADNITVSIIINTFAIIIILIITLTIILQ